MPRIALLISYDGGPFSGWQSQPGGGGVQDAVEAALSKIGESVRITGAGRTDAGVHARGQVAHFDASGEWEPRRLVLAINAHLPESVSVMEACVAGSGFDARRSALSREYRYFIWNSSTCYPHIKPYVYRLHGTHYDWNAAAEAALLMEGRHDFGAFCRAADKPDNTVRTVRRARLIRRGSLVIFKITADAYLTNMVRIAAGNLLSVAERKRDADWFKSLLCGGDRRESARTLPASGLFLWRVIYPQKSMACLKTQNVGFYTSFQQNHNGS
ncbi:MAG: tRNA pseudouridine(38-40) synthase TruA [Synergistaceae bacterium]|jgi:tRNA pseudouridine38-40 synthase|nr:tRNA pseudouridine(38-40) synthase TruA [Synergistaceae bacterium]